MRAQRICLNGMMNEQYSGLCDSNTLGGPAARIGFMVKKVKWLRQGELKIEGSQGSSSS